MKRALLAVVAVFFVGAMAAPPERPAKRSPALVDAMGQAPRGGKLVAWVFFSDKGGQAEARAASSLAPMTPRAASRRRLRGRVTGTTIEDLPLVAAYVDTVAAGVLRLRQRSRWLNAVSVEATAAQLEAIEALPFVARLDLVRRYRRRENEQLDPDSAVQSRRPSRKPAAATLDYGTSLGQLTLIGVPAVHEMGFHGEGVVVAVFDAGFNSLNHEVFSALHIVADRPGMLRFLLEASHTHYLCLIVDSHH